MYRLIIVEDHILFRMGISSALASHSNICSVVGEAGSCADFFALLAKTEADLVLLDIGLPDMNGIEIVKRLKKEFPHIKILVFSAENSARTIKSMVEAGING
ncbi:MAG: response regulator transcription factor, partial [Bacteroidales bacterium]|nr:response regulator transcription factor [Bacteroidales bacterium]